MMMNPNLLTMTMWWTQPFVVMGAMWSMFVTEFDTVKEKPKARVPQPKQTEAEFEAEQAARYEEVKLNGMTGWDGRDTP